MGGCIQPSLTRVGADVGLSHAPGLQCATSLRQMSKQTLRDDRRYRSPTGRHAAQISVGGNNSSSHSSRRASTYESGEVVTPSKTGIETPSCASVAGTRSSAVGEAATKRSSASTRLWPFAAARLARRIERHTARPKAAFHPNFKHAVTAMDELRGQRRARRSELIALRVAIPTCRRGWARRRRS